MFASERGLEMPHLGVAAILRIHHAPLAPAATPQGLYPQIGRMGGVGALHLGYDPRKWQLLRDDQQVIPGPEQFVLYQRGDSQ